MRILLERRYYSREGLIWGNTVYENFTYSRLPNNRPSMIINIWIFCRLLCHLLKCRPCPDFLETHFIQILSGFYLDKIRIKSGENLEKMTWTGLKSDVENNKVKGIIETCYGVSNINWCFICFFQKNFEGIISKISNFKCSWAIMEHAEKNHQNPNFYQNDMILCLILCICS